MNADALGEITIKQIEPGDKLTGLSLGHSDFAPLKAFARKSALTFERKSLARTYAAYRQEPVQDFLGYMTLVCGEVVISEGDQQPIDDGADYHYKHFPAVKLARLAVDRRQQGEGLGKGLVQLAIGIAKGVICPAVGCRFIMVDSKRQSVGFYEKCGFTKLDTAVNRLRDEPVMFIDLSKIEAP